MAGWMLSPGGLGVLGGARWPWECPVAPGEPASIPGEAGRPPHRGGPQHLRGRGEATRASRRLRAYWGGSRSTPGGLQVAQLLCKRASRCYEAAYLAKKNNIHPSPSAPVKSH